ncbi:hypothetical protein IQ06DRAFT_209913 [Phaeosphaeriaceae sp. SRC1lsM3a]|nr:hypothetical protein IQ06DRAFT_209913 [Stagonospora sp. SRC1lsM3a]
MAATDPFSDSVIGYPKLAAKFGVLPEAAIYRRFGALNAQDLLYYQAELTYLEQKLQEQQQQDNNDPKGHGASYAINWYWLKHSKTDGDGPFIQQATILGYQEPGKWDLHHLQDYLQTNEMGPLALCGDDATIWGSQHNRKSHKPDLVVLRPRAQKDALSVWAAESTIFNLFRCGCARFMKPSKIHGSIGYEDSTIYRITYWFTSILASLIPIASIAVLYQVQSMSARLGIIAAFNVSLSICLMGLANAKRAEVFAITAAYVILLRLKSLLTSTRFAAVQVVFVSADRSN